MSISITYSAYKPEFADENWGKLGSFIEKESHIPQDIFASPTGEETPIHESTLMYHLNDNVSISNEEFQEIALELDIIFGGTAVPIRDPNWEQSVVTLLFDQFLQKVVQNPMTVSTDEWLALEKEIDASKIANLNYDSLEPVLKQNLYIAQAPEAFQELKDITLEYIKSLKPIFEELKNGSMLLIRYDCDNSDVPILQQRVAKNIEIMKSNEAIGKLLG